MHALDVAIVGASGYSGIELTRILARHPQVRVAALFSDRWDGQAVGDRLPLDGPTAQLRYRPLAEAKGADAALCFLATPAEASLELAPGLLQQGRKVVDVSGAFRLAEAAEYPRWYGFEHTAPKLLAEARYGLPELAREGLKGARLIANPGCYATATALAIAPLIQAGVCAPEGISVCASSGISGAGRRGSEDYSFCELDEDLRAYKLGKHQHLPEIEQTVARHAGKCGPLTFTPQLVPLRRGILATATLRLAAGASPADLRKALDKAYAREPFVRVLEADAVSVKDVARTNRAHLGVAHDGRAGTAVAVCAIDNLIKGAAGQAVQAMNAAQGWDERLGLDLIGG
jgi:N-acetyl-gamma-glutamyl-phosphate reductase